MRLVDSLVQDELEMGFVKYVALYTFFVLGFILINDRSKVCIILRSNIL